MQATMPGMIGRLTGNVVQSTPQRFLLDVHGVGYAVQVSLSTFYEIEKTRGDGPVQLFIHTHVRDDAIALFGFATEREQQIFERLITVAGIGPRLAQVILSGMAPNDLLATIAAGDLARLTHIPGVGKKTAERMIVELKEPMRTLAASAPVTAVASAEDDLLLALVNLGYKMSQAERAVAQARQENPEGAFHELLRASLRRLSRI